MYPQGELLHSKIPTHHSRALGRKLKQKRPQKLESKESITIESIRNWRHLIILNPEGTKFENDHGIQTKYI